MNWLGGRYDAIEVEARFATEHDDRGYTTQPFIIPLANIESIGGDKLCTIRLKTPVYTMVPSRKNGPPDRQFVEQSMYVCERPSYEEIYDMMRVACLKPSWKRRLMFIIREFFKIKY